MRDIFTRGLVWVEVRYYKQRVRLAKLGPSESIQQASYPTCPPTPLTCCPPSPPHPRPLVHVHVDHGSLCGGLAEDRRGDGLQVLDRELPDTGSLILIVTQGPGGVVYFIMIL